MVYSSKRVASRFTSVLSYFTCQSRKEILNFSSLPIISENARVPHIEYNWIDGVESIEKYRPGGYHTVTIRDLLHDRYRIVDKLGFGGYSTVWLAHDTLKKQYVAVKVGIGNSLPRERKILRALSTKWPSSSLTSTSSSSSPLSKCLTRHNFIPLFIDEFEVHGPNGTHPCYTTTPARCNLKEVSYSRLFNTEVARALSGGLALAVAYVHSQGYVHGDIHIQNVMVKLPSTFDQLSIEQLSAEYGDPETVTITRRDGSSGSLSSNVPAKAVIPLYLGKDAHEFSLSDAQVLLSDFGEAFAPALDVRLGEGCHTPLAMRPPEARFEPQAPLSFPIDIWSLAVTIWEILGMKTIFNSEFVTADEITAQQIDVLGRSTMPQEWWDRWEERNQFFHPDGRRRVERNSSEVLPPIDQNFEERVQKYRRKSKRGVGVFDDSEEVDAILDLMRKMLAFRPEDRLTAEEVLKSKWMVKWVLPDVERSLQK